jgi:hypothetical protein
MPLIDLCLVRMQKLLDRSIEGLVNTIEMILLSMTFLYLDFAYFIGLELGSAVVVNDSHTPTKL